MIFDLVLTFLKIGTFTFGGGMVMVAFLQQDAVGTFGWLSQREFVDAVALGQVTPGPIVISAVFIGYKVAGLLGAVLALGSIMLPSFLMTIAVGHQLRRFRADWRLQSFLKGVSPAVVGLILAAGLVIAQAAVVDVPTLILSLACLTALVRFKVDTAIVIAAAAALGVLLF